MLITWILVEFSRIAFSWEINFHIYKQFNWFTSKCLSILKRNINMNLFRKTNSLCCLTKKVTIFDVLEKKKHLFVNLIIVDTQIYAHTHTHAHAQCINIVKQSAIKICEWLSIFTRFIFWLFIKDSCVSWKRFYIF